MKKPANIIYGELFLDSNGRYRTFDDPDADDDLFTWIELCKRRYPLTPPELRDIFNLSSMHSLETLTEAGEKAEEFVRREYFEKVKDGHLEGYMITEECYEAIREYLANHPDYNWGDSIYTSEHGELDDSRIRGISLPNYPKRENWLGLLK